ncbi:MAG: hypothetical protein ABSF50_07525 [Burkholderiaceae bacterium]
MIALFMTQGIAGALAQVPGGGIPSGSARGMIHQSQSLDDSKCAQAKPGSSTADRVNLELETSRTALELRSEQAPAWARFEESSKKALRDIARGLGPHDVVLSEMLGPQEIDQALDEPRNRLTALEEVADAAKQLYQVLSADQRKVADARLPKIVRLLASSP